MTIVPLSEILQQLRHGGDLVRLLVGRHLAKQQAIADRPGAHQMQRGFLCRPVEGASQRLAIDRDHALRRSGEVLHEAQEAGVELHGIEQPKYAAEGVVAGDAMAEPQKLAQECFLGMAEQRHVGAIFAPQSMVQRAIIRISCRSCRALSSRGSSSAAKQAVNRSIGPPVAESHGSTRSGGHAASPYSRHNVKCDSPVR